MHPVSIVDGVHTNPMPESDTNRPVLSTGQPASPGRVTGTARIIDIENPDDGMAFAPAAEAINTGDILIVDTLVPRMTEPARRAAGIVTVPSSQKQRRRPRLVSRAAIFARELGIPAIVGAEEFRDQVENGQPLVVDAGVGEIRESQFS